MLQTTRDETSERQGGGGGGGGGPEFTIYINDAPFVVTVHELTGSEIRQLPNPAIGPEWDLWEERPNGDILIENAASVHVHQGLRFFTVPTAITPGS